MSKHKLRRVLVLIPVALLCGALAMPVSAAPLGPAPDFLVQAWEALQNLASRILSPHAVTPTLRVAVGADDAGAQVDPVGQSEELKVSIPDSAVESEKAIHLADRRATERVGK